MLHIEVCFHWEKRGNEDNLFSKNGLQISLLIHKNNLRLRRNNQRKLQKYFTEVMLWYTINMNN